MAWAEGLRVQLHGEDPTDPSPPPTHPSTGRTQACWRSWGLCRAGLGSPLSPGTGVPSLSPTVLGGGDCDGVDSSTFAVLVQSPWLWWRRVDLELAKRDPWKAQHLADKKKLLERFWDPSSGDGVPHGHLV